MVASKRAAEHIHTPPCNQHVPRETRESKRGRNGNLDSVDFLGVSAEVVKRLILFDAPDLGGVVVGARG